MIAWRFVQGLLLPPIFAVTVAYIGDEWPPAEVAGVAGLYIAGIEHRRILRPFHSRRARRPDRLAQRVPRAAPCLSLAGAVAVAILLPREKQLRALRGLRRVGCGRCCGI